MTALDSRRLADGARALALASETPRTAVDLRRHLSVLEDGILAMQSLDDLGSMEANNQAWRDLVTLQVRFDELKGALTGVGHFVTSADSDYFIGYCPCNQLPCLSCVAAQEKLECDEALRCALLTAYHQHHKTWPQGAFIDDVVAVFTKHAAQKDHT